MGNCSSQALVKGNPGSITVKNSHGYNLVFLFAGQALVNFRTAIISSDGILLQWRPEDEDPCMWRGVRCDLKSKRVTAL